jgi:hypothetical protein
MENNGGGALGGRRGGMTLNKYYGVSNNIRRYRHAARRGMARNDDIRRR